MRQISSESSSRGRVTRRVVVAGPVAAALLAAVGCSSPSRQASAQPTAAQAAPTVGSRKVAITFPGPGIVFIPLEVAIDKGFFAQQGINIDASYSRGGPQVIAAIRSKSVDFIGTTIDLELSSYKQSGEKPLTMVTSLTRVPPFAIVGGSGVDSIAQLAGKTFGVFGLGSGDEVIAQYLISHAGTNVSKVKFVPLGADDAKIAALVKGDVAAVVVGEPARTILAKRGMPVLVNLFDPRQAKKLLGGGYQFTGLVTRPDVIAQKADLVQQMVNATIAGCVFTAKNDGKAITAALKDAAIIGGNRAQYATVMQNIKTGLFSPDGRIYAAEVNRVKQLQHDSGVLPAAAVDLDPKTLWTNQFVDHYDPATKNKG